jgi:hypothetical protein
MEARLAKEVVLLKEFDPDTALKKDFEIASLSDLQNANLL